MAKIKVNLSLLALLALVNITPIIAQQRTILVAGRAVDERRNPVSDAGVTLDFPPCRNCIDQVTPGSFTFPDGVFFIEVNPEPWLRLFIAEHVPAGFWSLIIGPSFGRELNLLLFEWFAIHV